VLLANCDSYSPNADSDSGGDADSDSDADAELRRNSGKMLEVELQSSNASV
jgi:hypothetical protein